MTEMLWAVVLLVVGFVLLIKGADFFVEGSSSVAKMLKVPSIIIGLTIVAMGTSLPECAVSITASVTNNNALAVSNAIGSNIFNLMVVCGFCALFNPLYVEKSTLKKEFPFSVVCAVLLLVCGYLGMQLGRADGIILLIVFGAFLVWMVRSALKARAAAGDDEYEVLPVWKCIVFIVGGIVAIKFGGDFVVNGASTVATKLGLSQNLIGLTIVACGTSLPELVTSVVAARKRTGYGARQCDRLQYFQYSVCARYRSNDQSDHIYHGKCDRYCDSGCDERTGVGVRLDEEEAGPLRGHCDAGALCGLSCVYLHAVA